MDQAEGDEGFQEGDQEGSVDSELNVEGNVGEDPLNVGFEDGWAAGKEVEDRAG